MTTPKEYQEMTEGGCPWCGEELVIRRGKYGEFIACAEWCGYTKSIPGRSEYPPNPYCEKCNHTGLVPSKVLGKFSGKPIPNCFTRCECNPEPKERYLSMNLDDFDFPMSDTFRAYSFEYCGIPDPGQNIPEETHAEAPQETEWTRRQWNSVQQLRGMVLHLQKKVNEHTDKKKKDTTYIYSSISKGDDPQAQEGKT